jgi:hypothetical protein
MAEEALQVWTKIIAMSVRNALESIHAKHISNDLMPDINRACRRGIYLALRNLFLVAHPKTFDDYVRGKVFLWNTFMSIPDYWEETELTPKDLAEEDERAKGKVLNLQGIEPKVRDMLQRHLFLWVEGQDLHEELLPTTEE